MVVKFRLTDVRLGQPSERVASPMSSTDVPDKMMVVRLVQPTRLVQWLHFAAPISSASTARRRNSGFSKQSAWDSPASSMIFLSSFTRRSCTRSDAVSPRPVAAETMDATSSASLGGAASAVIDSLVMRSDKAWKLTILRFAPNSAMIPAMSCDT